MNDADLLELYSSYSQTFTGETTLFISMLFAYVVAMFIIANRLTHLQFGALTSLFGLFSISVTMGLRGTCRRAVSLQEEIVRRIESDGSNIAFVAIDGFPVFLPEIMFVLCLSGLALALLFGFIQHRRPISQSVDSSL